MYTNRKDVPTVEMLKTLQSFVYRTGYYAEGERVHVACTHEHDRGYPHIDVLLDSGALLSGEGLALFQHTSDRAFIQSRGYRYLGTGVIHKRDSQLR